MGCSFVKSEFSTFSTLNILDLGVLFQHAHHVLGGEGIELVKVMCLDLYILSSIFSCPLSSVLFNYTLMIKALHT